MNFFEWWCIWSNQCRTNEKLQHANDLQQQNNQLLEQIRRMQLTPAQRAAEDKAREQLAARSEAEAQLIEEREHTAYFLILCFVTAVIGFTAMGDRLQARPASAIIDAPALQEPTPPAKAQATPDYAPRAELVRLPSNP